MARKYSAAECIVARPFPSDESVNSIPGIGAKRAEAFRKLGIVTRSDLLRHLPRRYEDRRLLSTVSQMDVGLRVQLVATVIGARLIRLRRRMSLAELTFEDATGRAKAVWFGQGYLARVFKPGAKVYLSGVVGRYSGLALRNPDYELSSDDESDERLHFGRLVPIYPAVEGLSQRMLRRWIYDTLTTGRLPDDVLPPSLARTRGFPSIDAALRAIHCPGDLQEAARARERFAYEELLLLQIGLAQARRRRHVPCGIAHSIDGPLLQRLRARLPYVLTAGQSSAAHQILEEMASPRPTVRLLQGDVGCGKTIVALIAAAACVDSGYSTAMMAPTELLALQHHRTVSELFEPLGVTVTLLTKSSGRSARDSMRRGAAQIVVGTHALFEQATEIPRLGLVIVDEQHRFGVEQRERLARKGNQPDRLHMTATPIPRSLALTLYGAMDITTIPDVPPGRQAVETTIVPKNLEPKVLDHVRKAAADGLQTYYICPRIDSKAGGAAGALKRFAQLCAGPFQGLRCALIHGRMPGVDKAQVLEEFRCGNVDVLVGTTVVEVGVDAPSAAIVIVEDAASFGISQLHQLRGRVGRGAHPGWCYLLGSRKSEEGQRRLEILCNTRDGFRIAQEDFVLRGPGETFGQRQTGLPPFRAADLLRDADLLIQARDDAEELVAADPKLIDPQVRALAMKSADYSSISY